ncbi:MAG TPA: acyl-CoA dehydrogenase family protein [Solirubrobacteraceae bacterium]|jgi:cyclohexanecarboxyl-CoA dehydrogenase|nr:acyl-CoA dehydrogenase family protein [Solirubrobacteraceae bacterium]
MDFELSSEQRAIRDTVREFARSALAPGYLDRARSSDFPWELHRRVAELGALGVLTQDEHNPLGAPDYLTAGVVVEELAYGDSNLANAAIIPMFTSALISEFATEPVRERLLGPLLSGEIYLAFGLTEPGSGSDAAAMRTTAVADADGYSISGEKTSVTMLGESEAILLLARTVRDGAAVGVSAFVVPLDAPGIATASMHDTGWRSLGRGTLALEEVRVSAEALVGAEGAAFRTVLSGFDFTRPLLVLTAVGCASVAIDDTVRYARERSAFGAPLARFEGISFPLAEHATRLEAARLLCYAALCGRGAGTAHTAHAAMAKWFGAQAATAAVHDCLLMHGNYGYTTELPFEQRLRDVMAIEIADGTAQVQKMIIARELFGADFLPYAR